MLVGRYVQPPFGVAAPAAVGQVRLEHVVVVAVIRVIDGRGPAALEEGVRAGGLVRVREQEPPAPVTLVGRVPPDRAAVSPAPLAKGPQYRVALPIAFVAAPYAYMLLSP